MESTRNAFSFGGFSLELVCDSAVLDGLDCGDNDLNEYFTKDSAAYRAELFTQTYVVREHNSPTAPILAAVDFCNDAILSRSMKRADRKSIPFSKRGFRFYPDVKVTRLGVQREFQKCGVGSGTLNLIKRFFLTDNRTGCRFITVDAYNAVVQFYERNGFRRFSESDAATEASPTTPLFFDLASVSLS